MRWYWWTIVAFACGWLFIAGAFMVRAALDCRKIETQEPEFTEFNSKRVN